MQVYVRPFGQALNANTTVMAVTVGSASVAVSRPGLGTQSVRIAVLGDAPVWVNFGKAASVTASVNTSMPLLGNSVETFLLPNDITHIAAVSSTTGSSVYITTGESA
jgi:hypothetical protein